MSLGQIRTTARWAVHGVPSCNVVGEDEGLEHNWLVLTTNTFLLAAYAERREASSSETSWEKVTPSGSNRGVQTTGPTRTTTATYATYEGEVPGRVWYEESNSEFHTINVLLNITRSIV
jgi:hypothetical protein